MKYGSPGSENDELHAGKARLKIENCKANLAAKLQIAYAGALSIKRKGIIQMTVKSDRWIRSMAEEAQLIHPFEARLVREVAGTRIISAGASSYGYDMRLADDGFRVFSPIHGREI